MQKHPGSKMRWFAGAVVAVAMVGASVSPAMARGYGPWGYGNPGRGMPYPYPHRRYNRGMSAGDVIGIAALIGTVAIIASSASRNANGDNSRSYPDDRDYRAYPDAPADYRGDGAGNPYRNDPYRNDSASYGAAMDRDQAVDACAVAVRDKMEGERGGYAQVVNVLEPRSVGQDSWSIDGQVERRSGYSGGVGETRRFSCDVKGDRVAEVYISRDAG